MTTTTTATPPEDSPPDGSTPKVAAAANGPAKPSPRSLPIGACTVASEPFASVAHFGNQVLGFAGIMAVHGPSGTGKTYAVDSWASSLGVPVLKLHLSARARGHHVLRELLGLMGLPTNASGRVLLSQVHDALVGRRTVIYVDEAHRLNREALQQLRWLFDQPGMRFALILIGTDFTPTFRMAPELETRLARSVRFAPMKGVTLLKALRAHHPILRSTPDEVLFELDANAGHGLWYPWENLLVTAAGYGATPEDGITPEIAAMVLGSVWMA